MLIRVANHNSNWLIGDKWGVISDHIPSRAEEQKDGFTGVVKISRWIVIQSVTNGWTCLPVKSNRIGQRLRALPIIAHHRKSCLHSTSHRSLKISFHLKHTQERIRIFLISGILIHTRPTQVSSYGEEVEKSNSTTTKSDNLQFAIYSHATMNKFGEEISWLAGAGWSTRGQILMVRFLGEVRWGAPLASRTVHFTIY